MTLYLDTSVIVRALTVEADTPRIQQWLSARDPNELAISEWVVTEFSSALALKVRTDQITPDKRAVALGAFGVMAARSYSVLPVESRHFALAARFADQVELALRAGDSLHLAVCADYRLTLCTLDRRLAEAAPDVGVPVLHP